MIVPIKLLCNTSYGTFHVVQNDSTPGVGEGGVLWISSDGDDRMGAKIKPPKFLGLPTKPQNIPGPKIKHQKNLMPNFRALKVALKAS